MSDSIFDKLNIFDPQQAFKNAIKKGMKEPDDWMYMHSTRFQDHFKHYMTKEYISYFNFGNVFRYKSK